MSEANQPLSTRLVQYGRDPILTNVREMVLAMAGFTIDTVTSSQELEQHLGATAEPYDVIVLCRSVPREERSAIDNLAAQMQTPVFQIEQVTTPESLIVEISKRARRPR